MGRAWHWFTTSRGWRAWTHYGSARGGVIAGGMAYSGVFSLFAMLLLGFMIIASVIGPDSPITARVVESINAQVPNLIGGEGSALQVEDLFATDLISTAGLLALVVGLFSGMGWIDGLREGVRAMFGVPTAQLGIVGQRVRDLVGLATFGLAILSSAVLSVVVTAAAGYLLRSMGLEGGQVGRVALRAAGVGVVLLVDAAIFCVLMKVLAGLPVQLRDLRQAALVGATALGVLKLFAGVLLGAAGNGRNPLFVSSAVLVGLLVWMNLVSRVVLVTASWAAIDPVIIAKITAGEGERVLGPQVGPAALEGSGRPYAAPAYGARAADRTTVAAGVVLGVAAAAGAGAVVRTVRSVVHERGGAPRRGPGTEHQDGARR